MAKITTIQDLLRKNLNLPQTEDLKKETPKEIKEIKSAMINQHSSDEEDEEIIWEPSDDNNETLKSLKYFRDFEIDGKKSTRKEIIQSFQNFDEWLLYSISEIVDDERSKEDKIFT